MVNLFQTPFTTAFFTHFYKKVSLFLALWLASSIALAASNSILIKNAELVPADDGYKLSAYLEISLDESLEEAVNKGVPLNFVYEFQLISPRKYWFDDEVVTKTRNFTLSYHALSRQYLVSHKNRQTAHEILSEALLELMQLEDWKVAEKSQIDKGETYQAKLLVRLDQSKLPKALQVEAMSSKDWNLSSQVYEWMPKELNKEAAKEPAKPGSKGE